MMVFGSKAVKLLFGASLLAIAAPCLPSETITYTYDARGRLVQVSRSGDVNSGVVANYTYDPADNRTNVTVSTGSSTPPSFSVSDVSAAEGGNLDFTVTKTGATSSSFSVNFVTANGTAIAGSDYNARPSTALTFTSTETAKTVSVVTIDDSAAESAETMFLNLSGATGSATISDAQGIGTINANDSPPPPSFSISDVSVTEGGNLEFTVTKTGETTSSFSVNFATANATATAGSDYTAKPTTTMTFTSTETAKTVTVATTDDATVEGVETLFVNLSSATDGATISDAQGVGTINDNDVASPCNGVTFSVSSNGAVTEGVSSGFTISKSGSTSSSCTVNYATANVDAVAPGDYAAIATTTLTFTSAQNSQIVYVTTVDDSIAESPETFTMNLSSPSGGAAVGTATATATISDNDTNNPPTTVDDSGSIGKCQTEVFNVTANDSDIDGDPFVVTAVAGGGFSVASSTDVQFSSTQSTGAKVGTYTVQDSRGASATGTLTVYVSGGVCTLSVSPDGS